MNDDCPKRKEESTGRRSSDPMLAAWSERMATLHADVVEVKSAIKEVASALTKLALVEERQTHHAAAQERAFAMMEKIEGRMREHELRLLELEKSEPNQQRIADLVDRAMWAIVAATAAFAASKLGLMG